MSYLLTVSDELVAAATDLVRIGSSISAANVSGAGTGTATGPRGVGGAAGLLFGLPGFDG